MDLPLSDGRKCKYTLTGVLVHVGGSSDSGHYFAYVKSVRGSWFQMNDDYVQPVQEQVRDCKHCD